MGFFFAFVIGCAFWNFFGGPVKGFVKGITSNSTSPPPKP